ncbi:lytic transglycosylase [Pseudoxanthomonas jiangsuensis]|uniref:lytic transglycosylase domain-containing protein n=1 Tax=Pseudoxanthomonas jiangsuensis TaxID=619688 RepID=UPI001391C9EB|nr:lytic transglycosylase domain-containing protein [Pseudoxanthomonas jiangsuensis]KAF1698883.1 lytic transglycosylase [Pseudoxanthomonas jiangsuensis]
MRRTCLLALLALPLPAISAAPPAEAGVPATTGAAATGVDVSAAASGDTPPPSAPTAAEADVPAPVDVTTAAAAAAGTRNGLAIYAAFRDGLAEPECGDDNARWRRHFAHAPERLADRDSDVLPLFGHVVDALREAHLPTEFALIPFIESGYAPGVRGAGGPAGLWQFVPVTARNHGIEVGERYDGRLSPAESTRAAVRYLKTLNGMFGGNWRLAAMAYNAGEYRVLQALRRNGGSALETAPSALPGLSPVTYAYVDKLHALACLLEHAGDRDGWREELDRSVLQLQAIEADAGPSLDAWAGRQGHDPAQLRRLNPALAGGRWPRKARPLVLAPLQAKATDATVAGAAGPDSAPAAGGGAAKPTTATSTRTHVVRRGDSSWAIARRHGLRLERLLELNGLGPRSTLKPGMVLRLE